MFDVEAFVAKLDSMGVILTALVLADGRVRVNRWRTAHAAEHAQQIEELWASEISDDPSRMNVLAVHLVGTHRRIQRGAAVAARAAGPPARPAAVP